MSSVVQLSLQGCQLWVLLQMTPHTTNQSWMIDKAEEWNAEVEVNEAGCNAIALVS